VLNRYFLLEFFLKRAKAVEVEFCPS